MTTQAASIGTITRRSSGVKTPLHLTTLLSDSGKRLTLAGYFAHVSCSPKASGIFPIRRRLEDRCARLEVEDDPANFQFSLKLDILPH